MRGTLIMLIALAGACGRRDLPPHQAESGSISFTAEGTLAFVRGQQTIVEVAIEIADDDSSRARGLMQRDSLPDRSGMLFIFPVEAPQSFWMANTQMALDLVFVGADDRIVSIRRYARPLSTEPVPSGAPARYVVELAAGFADSWGLVEGDGIEWERY